MAFSGQCQINTIGINSEDGRVHFFLKAQDGTFDWTPFIAPQAYNREFLAIALAAVTSNLNVVMQSTQTTSWAEIWWLDTVNY